MGSTAEDTNRMALITGGASGMGLAVGTALVKRGNWTVHLLDLNIAAGVKAVKALGGKAVFHKVNVTVYSELAQVFDAVFHAEGRLDFVFGNAGIVERFNIYKRHEGSGPPPELDTSVIEVNLKAVYYTSYLALHYFRQSTNSDRALVLTASCAGLYAASGSAMYGGTKHGVIGFMRSIANKYKKDGIRVNCICPGPVKTPLMEPEAWALFPQDSFTPISTIVSTVLKLIDGDTITDAKGIVVKSGDVYGKAVELFAENYYFRDQHEFCEKGMAELMGSPEANRDKL